jgi:anthranilate phosphoribosyltransferase
VSPCGPTRVTELAGGAVRERVVTPEDFGIARLGPEALAGADAVSNAKVIESILRGEAHPARGAIVINAAAASVVARGGDLRDAAASADRAIASGSAFAALERWRAVAARARAL